MEHRTVSLADQVFEHLEQDILSGKYQRGEILTENKLSTELGVSRTPIREALRRLSQEHLIEETGKGSVVIGITERDLEDIYLIRKKLEGLAAEAAALNHTSEQLEKLKEAVDLQEFYMQKHDSYQIKQMDNRFHNLVYTSSGSAVFYDVLVPLHKKVQKYRRASVENNSRAEASVSEHRAIYNAIAAGDAKLASELSIQHVNNAYMHIKGKGN